MKKGLGGVMKVVQCSSTRGERPSFFIPHPSTLIPSRRLPAMLRLADLREILHYVPQYRDKTFVIALDGAIVEDDNFRNLLLDIALLRSLRIGVALVHGAGHQIGRLAVEPGQTPSNIDGTGVTDAAT